MKWRRERPPTASAPWLVIMSIELSSAVQRQIRIDHDGPPRAKTQTVASFYRS